MRFINKIAAAGVAVVAAFAVVTALLVLSGPSPVKRADAQVTNHEIVIDRLEIRLSPVRTSWTATHKYEVEADGTNTVGYRIVVTSGGGLPPGTMTATTVLGNWRDSGTKTTTYECLGLDGDVRERHHPGVERRHDDRHQCGDWSLVAGRAAPLATPRWSSRSRRAQPPPATITVSGAGKVAALSDGEDYTVPHHARSITLKLTAEGRRRRGRERGNAGGHHRQGRAAAHRESARYQ